MPSDKFIEAALGPDSEEPWVVLLTIDHRDLPAPMRFVGNIDPVVSRGFRYLACSFSVQLPSSTDSGPPQARIQIENVSADIGAALRTVTDGVAVTLEIVNANEPDTVEFSFPGLTLREARVTAEAVTGTLGLDDIRLEPFPAFSFTPGTFPGLF